MAADLSGGTPAQRTRLRRLPEKAVTDPATLHAILDAGRVAHVGIATDTPYVIPMAYARDGDRVLVHGSTGSRLVRALADGAPACLTVTLLDGLVLARSAFESSMHYRCAMVFGSFTALTGDSTVDGLRRITEHLLPGRWDSLRPPHRKEIAATAVLALPLSQWSVKVSAGPPGRPGRGRRLAGVGRRHPAARAARRAGARRRPAARPGRARPLPLMGYRDLSYWLSSVDTPLVPGPALPGDTDVDVAIVGGGYTGLWTAYYLARADPGLRIAVLEAELCGYGASGRNGGWCSALLPTSTGVLAREHGTGPALAFVAAMRATVDEVGRAAAAEGIDCDYAKGGTVTLARTPVQLARAQAALAAERELGSGPDDLVLLDAAQASARVGATGVLGGLYTPHCARIHPAKLVRGLATAVRGLGVRVYEQTRVTAIEPGVVRTAHGRVRADVVVRATEGYTPTIPGHRRAIAPVYSLMLATAPLPGSFWDTAGLAQRETFSDERHLIIYGQRTADDRLAFGGRGAPYHYGSAVRPAFDREPRVFRELARVLLELFPALGPRVPVEYTWGGPLGIARDWHASVGLDRATGLAWAGGYVGDGVGTTNLAGRTLTDLILRRDTELTALPWVGHRSPRWEPEPLRWLGVNTGLRVLGAADAEESRTGQGIPPRQALRPLPRRLTARHP